MNTFGDFWLGYTNSLVTNSSFLTRTIVDLVIVFILLFLIFNFFNSNKGWRFIVITTVGLVLLIVSSYFELKGIHILAQFLLIATAATFPIMFSGELNDLFTQKLDEESKLPKNNRLKFAYSLAASIVLTLLIIVAGNGAKDETNLLQDKLTVSAVNLSSGLTTKNSSQVSVTISADRSLWSSLGSGDFSATVDAANQLSGTYQLPVSVTSKVSGVKIVKVSPATIFVTVQPVVKKTVPVVVNFSGKAGQDLVPDVPVISPGSVVISGAQSVLDIITQVVAPITLSGETTPIDKQVPLQVLDSAGNSVTGVTIEPSEVRVTDNIIKPGITKTVGILPTITGSPSNGYWVSSVTTDVSTVIITGAPDVLQGVNSIATAPISVNGIGKTTTTETALVIPAGITLSDTTISKVKVVVNISDTQSSKTITPQFVFNGTSASLKVVSISPVTISAVVTGAASALSSLTDSNVQVGVDLSSYQSAGTYSITLHNSSFTLPSGLGLASFLPSVINVTLDNK